MSAAALLMTEKRKPGRPKSSNKRETVINVKAVPEYKTWLDEFAGSVGLSVADTIGMALAQFAETRGFRLPPKR